MSEVCLFLSKLRLNKVLKKGFPVTQSVALSQGSLSCGGLIHKACRLICLQSAGKASQRPCAENTQLISLLLPSYISSHMWHFTRLRFVCASSHCETKHSDSLSFWVIAPPCCLLYVFLSVKLPSESQQKKSRCGRSTRKECYREAHPNIQTIALHDLYYVHTKCSPTVQDSLQGFVCTVWLWCYLWSLNYHGQILCDVCSQQTKTTWKDTKKILASFLL